MSYGTCSLEGDTISHDGTILKKAGIEYENIKCKASFDITIELTSGMKFTGNIPLELPVRKYT